MSCIIFHVPHQQSFIHSESYVLAAQRAAQKSFVQLERKSNYRPENPSKPGLNIISKEY
jgi:hypothetical protein